MSAVETHLKRSNWKTKQHGPKSAKQVKRAKQTAFVRVEKLVSENRAKSKNLKRLYRHNKKPEAKIEVDTTRRTANVYLVVRCGTTYGVDPTMQKAFKYLGLGKVNTAVFVKANPTMDKILSNLKDYLCWGSPDIGMIQSFIQKRGYAVINQQLTPLTDNKMIEDQLGKHNIVCIEDIVHEITTVGPAFSIITKKWLAPFKVPTPKGGWVLQIGNGNKASHIDVDEYGVPIEHKIKHNGLHQPEEFKKIVTPMI